MKKVQLFASASLLVLLLLACGPEAALAPAPQTPAQATAPVSTLVAAMPVAPAKSAWQEEWEKTQTAAQKEGTVAIHTSGGATTRNVLLEVAQVQRIKAEIVSMRTDEFVPRALAERRAGLYLNDIWVGGLVPAMVIKDDRPPGLLDPLASAFILPDLTDPASIKKVWYKGEIPWANSDQTIMVMTLTPRTPVVINTNLVKEGEVKSWRDVLNPKWKGKIIVGDPTVAGAGQLAICAIDSIMGWDYVKELAKLDPMVMRDQRQQMDWLAHGKAAIVVGPQPEQVTTFLKLGLPLKGITPSEGSWVSPGSSALSLFGKGPHVNAAKVFVNWVLSKEGQTAFALALGFQSTREDVTTQHLRPDDVRAEGGNYIKAYGEDFAKRQAAVAKLAKDLFGPMVMK